ncbi:MAG: methionine--tRNA ligase [Thermoplasmata archaeon]|nr:methionine--tRNA ligase [Thermoplasmata archaeon]
MARIFVGVAWPYANGPFHIGHLAGSYLPGDSFARFHRLRGDEVLMVSGSDMHGTPILVAAEKEGASAETIARRNDAINRDAFVRLGVSFDTFTSTHTLVHERTVQELFLTLLENGFVGRRTSENPYCPKHERFLPDRYLVGTCPFCADPAARGDECDHCGRQFESSQLKEPRCSLCGTPAEFRPTEHFYLLLDKLEPKIREYLADKSYWRSNVTGVVENFLREGLKATPITRDLDWGIPIPLEGYSSKRFYVWFEAVIGYLSASKEWAIRAGRPDAYERYWLEREPVRSYYFLGKDNIFFHTVTWPAILIGRGGLKLPYDVAANEWMQVDGRKISKSRTVDEDLFMPALLAHYPPDLIRFYAALLAPQNHDTDFRWEEFHQVTDDILSNQYGNLAQRVLVLTRDRCANRVPEPPGDAGASHAAFVERLKASHEKITAEYERVHLKEALELALGEVREANRRFHDAKPWSASDDDRRRILFESLWTLKAAAIWLSPVIPFSSAELFRMLGYAQPPSPGDWEQAKEPVPPAQELGEIRPLFLRREARTAAPPAASAPKAPPSSPSPTATTKTPAEFDIRSAVILEVENHPSADRLYVIRLDVGEAEPRTVVAGIRPFYSPEQLRGRRVALLANLEPRTIRKVTSHGMLLAADDGTRARLLTSPATASPGSGIEGTSGSPRVIRYEEFERTPMLVGRSVGPSEGGGCRLDVGGREVTVPTLVPLGTLVVVRLVAAEASTGSVLQFAERGPILPDPELAPGSKVR